MSSREAILAKKAKLAELKRQRAMREEQNAASRLSIGGETSSPGKTSQERRHEIDHLVASLIDRRRDSGAVSPITRNSRPSSIYGTANVTPQNGTEDAPRAQMQSVSTQTLTVGSTSVVFEDAPSQASTRPKVEYITYSKGVQTEPYLDKAVGSDDEYEKDANPHAKRRLSRREQERDEEIRANLRKEIEEELNAVKHATVDSMNPAAQQRYPLRQLTTKELNAVTSSTQFQSFIERSAQVLERALDEEYDLLADYTRTSALDDSEDDSTYARTSKRAHSLRETVQLYSERHSRRRMISDIQFSPHFSELLLSSYTKNPTAPNEPAGLVLLWNIHAPSRPEYTFTAGTDILSAQFSPFHPNLVIGGCYSGQICLWDTRTSGRTGAPVQKTPLSGSHFGHTHPIYSINIIGTPNAHNILTTSTDGVICSWSVDMLTQPQEYLELTTPPPSKTDDLAPTTTCFPASDPTFFLVGTEEGSIYPCHRYDRAGAKAGVDNRLAYRGHTAPVMSTRFHPARGPVDVGDLMLSSSTDWSVKLWRVKPATGSGSTSSTAAIGAAAQPQIVRPVLDIPREDLVYDAKWAPHRPSVFACVTGSGEVEVFDLNRDLEVPLARAAPSRGKRVSPFKGLNKCAWEERKGGMIAAGGLDGVVTVFEVGKGLSGGAGEAKMEEWMGLRKLVNRLEAGGK